MERIKCRGERAFWSWHHFGLFWAILGPKQVDLKCPKWCQLWKILSPRHFIRSSQLVRLNCAPGRAESICDIFGSFPAHFRLFYFRRSGDGEMRSGFWFLVPIYFLSFDKKHSRFSRVIRSIKETFLTGFSGVLSRGVVCLPVFQQRPANERCLIWHFQFGTWYVCW